MNGTKEFKSKDQAIDYLTHRFTDDGPNEIAGYVEVLRAAMKDEGEAPGDWWKDVNGDDLAEWIFRII